MKPLAELLGLLRRQLFPALGHSPPRSGSRLRVITATTKAKASEQNPAEGEQPEGLPEIDLPQSEQRRRGDNSSHVNLQVGKGAVAGLKVR